MLEHKEIGQRIELRRKDLGMTLADVADEVGVAASTIQRYEKGQFDKIKMPVVEAIAAALQVNPAWIVGETDDPTDYEDGDLLASIPLSYMELFNGDPQKALQYMQAVDEDALKELATANTGRGLISDADIKFALFGNAEIDDEVLDEVKRFAKFAIEQKEQRKQSD